MKGFFIMKEKQLEVEDKPLIYVPPKKRTIFFAIMYGLFVIDFISRVGINAIFPVVQADLGLSDMEVGMMGSVVLLGMAILVLPVSFLGEKYSPKKAISLSALVWSVGTLLSGMASNFSLLLMSRFMVGAGNSAYAPLSNSLITSMYSKKDWGKKIGIYNTAMTLGMALGAIVFANLADNFGWRVAFYTVGVISILLTIASLSLPDSKKMIEKQCCEEDHEISGEKNKAEVNLKIALKVIGKNRSLIGICFGAGLMALVMQGILSWLSIYFVREMGMSIGLAASLISVLALISALGYPLGGMIMDKWYMYDKRSRVFLPVICITIATVCFLVGLQFKLVPVIFLASFCLTTANTSYHVSTQELVPSWFKSVSYGVYVLFIQLFGAVGPLLTGVLSEKMGLTQALSAIQVLLVVASVVFFLTSRVYVSDFMKARKLESESGLCE